MIRRIRLQRLAPQDRKAWQKQYYEHQKHWQRRRLLALKAIWDGHNLSAVCREQKVRWQTLIYWLDSYLHGGFDRLLEKAPVHRSLSGRCFSFARDRQAIYGEGENDHGIERDG